MPLYIIRVLEWSKNVEGKVAVTGVRSIFVKARS